MTLEEVFSFCADLGFDAVDPTGYYFPEYPDTPPDEYVYALKRKAFLLGLDISGTGVRNDFTMPDAGARRNDVNHVRRWIDTAAKLGAPVIRVFTGKSVPAGYSRSEVQGWVVEALRQCAAYGGRRGVMAAIQNHADFLTSAAETIALLEEVNSNWLGLVLDIGSFLTADPYEDIAQAAPYAVTWQIKEQIKIAGRQAPTDLSKIAAILLESGYRGYIPIETLGEGDPREKVRRFYNEVRTALA